MKSKKELLRLCNTILSDVKRVRTALRRYRKEAGVSQGKFAYQMGITSVWLCHIETGKVEPSMDTLRKIKDTLQGRNNLRG